METERPKPWDIPDYKVEFIKVTPGPGPPLQYEFVRLFRDEEEDDGRVRQYQDIWIRALDTDGKMTVNYRDDFRDGRPKLDGSHKLIYARRVLDWECTPGDFDDEDKLVNKARAEAMLRTCAKGRVPAYLLDTGGKGYHVVVFFDPGPVLAALSPDEVKLIDEQCDFLEEIRLYIWEEIVQAGKKNGVDQDLSHYDTSLLKWGSHGKGKLTREAGGVHSKTGRRATYIEYNPDGTFEFEILPKLAYPTKVYVLDTSPFVEAILKRMRKRMEGHYDKARPYNGPPMEVPCMVYWEEHYPPKGYRNTIGYHRACVLKLSGLTEEEARADMEAWTLKLPDYDEGILRDNLGSVSSAFRGNVSGPTCRKCRDVDEAACIKAICPFYRKEQPAPAPEGQDPFTFTKACQNGIVIDTKGGLVVDREKAALYTMANLTLKAVLTGNSAGGAYHYMYYQGGRYYRGAEELIERSLEGLLAETSNDAQVREIKNKVLRRLLPQPALDDNREGWINLSNGYFNYITRELRPHTPDMVFISQLPVAYDPEAKCPRIHDFLTNALDQKIARNKKIETYDPKWPTTEQLVAAYFELSGYLLMGGQPIQQAFLFYGPGNSGKSVAGQILEAFVGKDNTTSVTLDSFSDNRFATSMLYGKKLNMCGELDGAALKGTSAFKRYVSGESFTAEEKNKPGFVFLPQAKLVFTSNAVPQSPDRSTGYYRRWNFFPFPNVVPPDKVVPFFERELTTPEELSGLFNEALLGIDRLTRVKRFSNYMATEDAQIQYDLLSDTVGAFLEEECEELPPTITSEDGRDTTTYYMVQLKTLFAQYESYCRERRLPPVLLKQFKRELKKVKNIYIRTVRNDNLERICVWNLVHKSVQPETYTR